MIIRKANIVAFAGITNKTIEFSNGVNIIYGGNEAGKSTIQNFIKIWLFGMNSKRSKDIKNNDRLRFTPISGEKIKGQLYVEHLNRIYIIERSFGLSKKEDTSEVLDALTGEKIDWISKNEPGKYFLGVNLATFSRTLFISQLGVGVSKDKDDEIMERAANLLGSGNEKISIQKSMERLESIKKSLVTIRRTGRLDLLRSRYSDLLEERYERRKLAEQNIDNEEKIIGLKDKRSFLRKELKNLDIYKKYKKKIKLQKEYEEITEYLKKSEELKQKERFIEESISVNGNIIDISFLNDIKEENSLYLSLLDLKSQSYENLNESLETYNIKRESFKDVLFVENLDTSVKEKILRNTMEQEVLKEKLSAYETLNDDITKLNLEIDKRKAFIGDIIKFKGVREDIDSLLKKYEEKLKELKFKMENNKSLSINEADIKTMEKKLLSNRLIFFITIGVLTVSIMLFKANLIILLPLIAIAIFFGNKLFRISVDLKGGEASKRNIYNMEELHNEIACIEEKLFSFNGLVNAKNYEDFIKKLKIYDDFIVYEEKQKTKIREKQIQLKSIDIEEVKERYNENLHQLNYIFELANTDDINEIIQMISKYEVSSKDVLSLKIEIEKEKESVERLDREIKIREDRLNDKLESLGLKEITLENLEEKLLEIKNKVLQRDDIKRSLESIEETYKALTKDKDIDGIKEEIKEIINEDISYSYESEEEIDNQIKSKSNDLIEIEKSIKDVENEINTKFIGKRDLSTIDEELEEVSSQISKSEKKLKATEVAIETLEEAFREARTNFGPMLNSKVLNYFKEFSKDEYSEVMVSDSYEIKVRNKENLLLPGELLSNGANDQLYLSLRLAFIEMLYNENEIPVILDDAFVQYDDERVKNVLSVLYKNEFNQLLIFTCQNREKGILDNKNLDNNYICL